MIQIDHQSTLFGYFSIFKEISEIEIWEKRTPDIWVNWKNKYGHSVESSQDRGDCYRERSDHAYIYIYISDLISIGAGKSF